MDLFGSWLLWWLVDRLLWLLICDWFGFGWLLWVYCLGCCLGCYDCDWFVDCASGVCLFDVVCCVMLVAIVCWLVWWLISVFCWLLRLIRELRV